MRFFDPFRRLIRFITTLSFADCIVACICVVAFFGVLSISNSVFDEMPHLEDEFAYVWQAEVAARGEIFRPTPPCPRCFLVPFVIDNNGVRFGKYPLPWPVMLSFGVRFGIRSYINPLLAALSVWLLYRLLAKIRNPRTGVIGAMLIAISPFFLILSSTLLSHTFSLFLALIFMISWIDIQKLDSPIPISIRILTCGLSMGLLVLSRPLTALGVMLPFAIEAIIIITTKDTIRKRNLLLVAGIISLFIPLYFLWQFILTGDPLRNPYTFVWPYDTIGFGPGIGRQPGGYQPPIAIKNARASLYVGMFDLFGWLKYSWLFLPAGFLVLLKNRRAWMVFTTLLTIVAAYGLYWIGSDLLGPRYYFEALPACVLLTAAAFDFLLGKLSPEKGVVFWRRLSIWRFVIFSILIAFLLIIPVIFYLPARLPRFHNLYGASADRLLPFKDANKPGIAPALIVVHITQSWTDYSSLTELSNPYFDTPLVFSLSKGKEMDAVSASMFPGRYIWHYYPDEPFILRISEK